VHNYCWEASRTRRYGDNEANGVPHAGI
jgi:hypothetical protein